MAIKRYKPTSPPAGLNKLSEQLNDPIAVSLLDYEKNAETSKYLTFLQRVKRSLTQYSEKKYLQRNRTAGQPDAEIYLVGSQSTQCQRENK